MAKIETYAWPTWLYRYRSLKADPRTGRACLDQLAREIDAVLQGYIYCSRYTDMNDPMEGFYRASIRARDHEEYSAFIADVREEKLGLGIASLSETWYNELMWAHYADQFRGICVVYVASRLLHGLSDGDRFARVAYGDKPYHINLEGLRSDARARAILSTKNLKWSYEREWRLFAKAPGEAHHGHGVIPTIFLGTRMHIDDRDEIARRLEGSGIQIKPTCVDGYEIKELES